MDSNHKNQFSGKRIFKSRKDRMIDGICGGVAEYTGVDVTLVRILWVASIFVNGLGIVAYILFMIFVPLNPDHLSLKQTEMKKQSPALFIGLFFILSGCILVLRNFDFCFFWPLRKLWRLTHWWGLSWNYIWPLILIVLGVGYVIFIINRDKPGSKGNKTARKLYRAEENKILGGVCSGLADHLGIDPTLIRIGFVVLSLFLHVFPGVLFYVILLIVIPVNPE